MDTTADETTYRFYVNNIVNGGVSGSYSGIYCTSFTSGGVEIETINALKSITY